MNDLKFSVLISVYIKEKPEYLRESLYSIVNQTKMPNEVVLVCDGELTKDLYDVIDEYKENYADIFKIISYKVNRGLGEALNSGLKECSYNLVARMDSDDICREDRFEIQTDFIKDNPDMVIVGSNILEFDGDINNVISYRKVPITPEEVLKFAKKRNPFNHMTVMFRKEEIVHAGGYQDMPLAEDYYLWARVLKNGNKCANINDILVYARGGEGLIKRRNGIEYVKKIIKLRKALYRIGFINFGELIVYSGIHSVVAIMPVNIQKLIYSFVLHKK